MIIFPKMLTFICFLTFMIPSGTGLYTTINSKPNVTFRYMDNVDGESDIHECEVHEVCNVVHNRFWMSTLTERLCRCPNGKECPWQWTPKAQNSSILLNNKSYLKFCNQVTDMDACTPNINAAMVYGKGDRKNSYIVPYNVTINCVCPETHYWRLQKYTYEENDLVIQVFKCVKKRMCESYDFCGHIRSDLYSTYYRCTCPLNHLCIFKDRNEENVQELLYSGPAYRAYCLPIKTG